MKMVQVRKYISILFMLLSFSVVGMPPTTYTTVGGPTWTTGGNWSGGSAPSVNGGTNNTYNINNTMSVTTGTFTLGAGSTMTICNTCTLTINGNLTFANGSTFNLPQGAVLIVNGTLTNNNNSTGVTINGSVTVNGSVTAGNGSTITGTTGTFNVSGTISTSGSATIFGDTSACTTPPCSATSATGVDVGGLPVELISFSGERFENEVILYWSTASEINNDYFEVESSDNCTEWNKVGFVSGWGNSNIIRNYRWIDNDPSYSYYRLKQVDFDGKSEYHKAIYLPITSIKRFNKTINVNPNPIINEKINVELNGFRGEEVLLILMDELGREHYSKVVVVESDKEVFIISTDGKLSRGLYIILGSSMNNLYNKHILIK